MTNKTKSSQRNNQILMHMSEEEQFNNICLLLEQNTTEALKIANSTLKSKKYFQDLLEKGLESADASEIEIWLKYLVPRLGIRYVIKVLEGKVDNQSKQVVKATYWLEKFLNGSNGKELQLFKNLESKVRGEEYKSVASSGITYKLILKIKGTDEFAVFGGYQMGSHGSGVIAEILDSHYELTGAMKIVSPSDLEILDPQPYDD